MTDLLQRTAELVAVPSVSLDERRLADEVEAELRRIDGLEVERVDDNVVARTQLGRPLRLVLAGHLDTVPVNGNATPTIDGDVLWGLGSADMKGGLAVMLEVAHTLDDPAVDVTWIFYSGETTMALPVAAAVPTWWPETWPCWASRRAPPSRPAARAR